MENYVLWFSRLFFKDEIFLQNNDCVFAAKRRRRMLYFTLTRGILMVLLQFLKKRRQQIFQVWYINTVHAFFSSSVMIHKYGEFLKFSWREVFPDAREIIVLNLLYHIHTLIYNLLISIIWEGPINQSWIFFLLCASCDTWSINFYVGGLINKN